MTSEGTVWRARSVRRANLATVLSAVRHRGPASRSQLVAATGLTRSAIGELVTELGELGLVSELAATPDGSPGRPSPIVQIDDTRVGALAIEINVDGIGVGIVGLDGTVVHSRSLTRAGVPASVEATVASVLDLVDSLDVDGWTTGRRHLVGIGVAIPGLVDHDTNVVRRAPNLDWTSVPLGEILARRLGLHLPVFVVNDGDVGALAEMRFGAAVGVSDMVYVSGEVGVGGGIFSGGRRIVGRSGLAGEIGHVPVNPNGSPCRCGSRGCWETEIGEAVLLTRAGRDPAGGPSAIDEMMDAAQHDEHAATAALAEQARWLGIGIAGLINIFDPELVVLGGFLGSIFPVIRNQLFAEVSTRGFGGIERSVDIVAGKLGAQTGLIGAGERALEPVLSDPLMVAQFGSWLAK